MRNFEEDLHFVVGDSFRDVPIHEDLPDHVHSADLSFSSCQGIVYRGLGLDLPDGSLDTWNIHD